MDCFESTIIDIQIFEFNYGAKKSINLHYDSNKSLYSLEHHLIWNNVHLFPILKSLLKSN